ncbi:MAG: hypothetical protein NPIRA04_25350 [Nitrospirales bacterium]|nr:MAG: hypothetical protein NPIRA04_25350 [Nitrospirales bacterium]
MSKQNNPRRTPRSSWSEACGVAFLSVTFSLMVLSMAHATALGRADVQAQLTMAIPANGIEFGIIDSFGISDTIENGHASAIAHAPTPLSINHGIQMDAKAAAHASPTGSAMGIGAAFGVIELRNTTTNPVDIDLTVIYEWSRQGSVVDPNAEEAFAEIALEIFINDVAQLSIFEDNSTSPNFSMGSGNTVPGSSITQTFSGVSLSSGSTFVEMAVAAQADASSATVPEPSTLLLLGSGLIGITLYYRKK